MSNQGMISLNRLEKIAKNEKKLMIITSIPEQQQYGNGLERAL
jgi:hypothetical protein